MPKCANTKHQWVLRYSAPKTWAMCQLCSERYPLGPEVDGTRFRGPVPEKYTKDEVK